MRRQIARLAGTAAVTAGLLSGCQSGPSRPYDDNPLLMSRQPLVIPPPQPAPSVATRQDAKVQTAMAVPPAPPPAQPPAAVVVKDPPKPDLRDTVDAGPLLPAAAALPPAAALEAPAPLAAPAPVPQAPVPAKLVVEASALPAPAESPQPVLPTSGRYDHSADYTRLRGEIDRNYRGAVELRYRPASEDDAWGGKVRLADDPRLAEFKPGDVVAVEGEIVRDGRAETGSDLYPRFHVREIRLVERAGQK